MKMIISDGLVIGQLGLRNSVSIVTTIVEWASLEVLVVKNLPASAGDIRDAGSIPGSGRSPRGGHGNPLQHSWLENFMNRGVWRATVRGAAASGTRLKHMCTPPGQRLRGEDGSAHPHPVLQEAPECACGSWS